MPKTIGASGAGTEESPVPALFAEGKAGAHTVYRAVHRERANPRAGTASTKRRDEVSGGGKKPWKQKGTGRARQGSTRSPQWRHGGSVFGPKPRSYKTSLNKKERRAAFISALADRFAAQVVTYLDVTGLSVAKTKDFAATLLGGRRVGDAGETTLVVFAPDERAGVGAQLLLGGRNLRTVQIACADALEIRHVLAGDRILMTHAALRYLEETGAATHG